MSKFASCAALGVALLVLGIARGKDEAAKTVTDDEFVMKASAAGLAEVNFGRLAVKMATDDQVRKFAKRMVDDHTMANQELLTVANKKRFKVASSMDAAHENLYRRLARLKGSEFDREYMASQVKDHYEAVSLFTSQSKNGKDEDLRKLAAKTLPTLREHRKMADDISARLKSGKARDR